MNNLRSGQSISCKILTEERRNEGSRERTKFYITSKKIPIEQYIEATEQPCSMLPQTEVESLRADMKGTLKSAKPSKSNISKDERNALKAFGKNETTIILPADKGRATVVMDKTQYEKKVREILDNEKTYSQLKWDPTAKYKIKLIAILTRLKREGKITEQQYFYLYPSAEAIPRLYCTPKIHKKDKHLDR